MRQVILGIALWSAASLAHDIDKSKIDKLASSFISNDGMSSAMAFVAFNEMVPNESRLEVLSEIG